MVNYEDYEEEDVWSEDYEDEFHEDDYELSEEEISKMKEEEELLELDEEEAYNKILEKTQEEEYEYDEVVGARDKKPVLSALNKKKLSKYEMDALFNKIDEC